MKHILIPIDFTSVSINALKYAIDCFSESKLTILHVRPSILDPEEPVGVNLGPTKEGFWAKSIKLFVSRELQLHSFPDTVDVNIELGAVNNCIKVYAENNDVDCIVMGTRDKYNLIDKWFGTISLDIVKNCDIPVYLIPKYAKYSGHNKIMIASDYNSGNPEFIEKIKNWNQGNAAHIHFLHIQDKPEDDYDEVKKNIVSQLFENDKLTFSFEIETIKDREISKSVLATAYNRNIDLLVVIPEKQNLLQRILFKSVSKELILQSELPILFINK